MASPLNPNRVAVQLPSDLIKFAKSEAVREYSSVDEVVAKALRHFRDLRRITRHSEGE